MAARRTTAASSTEGHSAPAKRRTRPARAHRAPVLPRPRLVEDDTEVLAAEHEARDAELLDLVARLSV